MQKMAVVKNLEQLAEQSDSDYDKSVIAEFMSVFEDYIEQSNQVLEASRAMLNMPTEENKDLVWAALIDYDEFVQDES